MKHFNKLKQLFLALLVLAGALPALGQPLSGTYTVGGTSPNYATLTAAVADLNSKGVSGPVTFNLRNGTYNEKVTVNSITGASATNRVTFKSETNNAANVTISSSATSYADIGCFHLNNASYVTIKNLTLQSNGTSSYGGGVQLAGAASNDSILSCAIQLPTANINSQMNAGIYAYYNGSIYASGTNNVIQNNTISGGGTGITIMGNGSTALSPMVNNWIIENNTFTNFYYMGMALQSTGGMKFRNNTFTTNSLNTSAYCIYVYYSSGLDFSGNTFTATGNFYMAFYLWELKGAPTNAATWPKFENNTFNFTATTYTSPYLIYAYYGDYTQWKNNTFNVNTTTGSLTMNYWYSCPGYLFEGNTVTATATTASIYAYHYYSDNIKFRKNTLNYTTGTSGTVYGVQQANSGNNGGDYSSNKINCTSGTGSVYGLYQAVPGQTIYNNAINTSTSGTNYTLYATNPTNTTIANNTCHSRATGGTNYAGYISSSSGGTKVHNNVFSKTNTTGWSLYVPSSTNIACDYNNIYTAAGTNLVSNGTSYSTLQAWRTATGKDMNSLSYDPGYTSATNLAPDPANASSWSLNGRGIQIAGNSTDINGAARSTTLAGGVPDLGAYEFTPTATPPAATATPAVPTAGTTQIFTLGQDTVASLVWPAAGTVPASITVRQYTGTNPPTINTISSNKMFFYTDISVPAGTYAHTSNIYYKDPWMGTIGGENALRLAKKDGANPWVAYGLPASTVDINRNIIATTGQTVFGLHTGIDASDNASAAAVANPTKPFCTGTHLVKALVRNTGNNTLNSVTINWSVDGVTQTPVSYTTPINTLGSGLGNEATVDLGNVTFATAQRVIKIWTSSPNGVADLFNADDTVSATLRTALNGVYTIGGTTPDYPTIAAAVTDLNLYGVCGPVTFNLRNGTYNAQTVLKPVFGASAVNRITFKSETNNAANVTVSFANTSSANYVVKFDSASYFTFRDLTLSSTNASYGYIVHLAGTASYDSVVNCNLAMAGNTSSSSAGLYVYYPFPGVNNAIVGNTITSGYYGAYIYGSASVPVNDLVFDNNTMTGQYYYGVYAYYTNNLKLRGNSVTNTNSPSSYYYALNLNYCNDALEVRNNAITITANAYVYGWNMTYNNGGTVGAKITGNTMNITNTSTAGYPYPTYYMYCANDSVANNTFNVNSLYYQFWYFAYNGNNTKIYNNTFNLTTTSSYYAQIYLGAYGNNSRIGNNTINMNSTGSGANYLYGYYAINGLMHNNNISLTSTSGVNYLYVNYGASGNIFRNNTVTMNSTTGTCYNYASYAGNNDYTDNTINMTSTSGPLYGLYIYQSSYPTYSGGKVERNTVNCTSTSGSVTGMYNYYSSFMNIMNNIVKVQTSGTSYGLDSRYNTNTNIYNNLFYSSSTGATNYAAYVMNNATQYGGLSQSTILRNNIMYKTASTGFCLGLSEAVFANPDYNNLYTAAGTNIAQLGSTSYATLQGWRSATNRDLNSIVYDPGFTSASNLRPNPSSPASWSLQGRGEHAGFNSTDMDNNPRVTSVASGVPDIGPYEFTPTVTPPSATPNIVAAAGSQQVFTLGQDTVAVIDWDASATIPSSIDVKQYTGTIPPSFIAGNYPYFYTDIATPSGSYAHGAKIYYKDPWVGTLTGESGFRLVKKDGANPWQLFAAPASATDPARNINTTTGLTTFGYHSLSDVANNAATVQLMSPIGYFCAPSTLPIQVKIKNNGNNILNTVKVGWTANGIGQTTYSHTTPINVQGSPQGNEATVTVGNYTFTNSAPVQFVFYTFSPNNLTDPAPADDTLKITIKPGLNGTYTIGGVTPDYATIPDAIADMNQFGICGPVVFNIRDGNYTAGGTIKSPLQGSSTTNRVTFQAESGIAANVVVTTANAATFDISNVSNITFNKLKLVNTAGTCVTMNGSASNDSIVRCILQGPTSGGSATYSLIYAPTFSGNNNVVLKNTMNGGYNGVYFYNGGTNTIIDSNTFSGQYYSGAFLYYTNGVKLRANQITTTTAAPYGVYFYGCNNAGTNASDMIGNTINHNGYNASVYGISTAATASARGTIAKNIINVNSTSYAYCYLGYSASYYDIYDNEINTIANNSYCYNYIGYSSSYLKIYRNKMNASGTYGYGFAPAYSSYSSIYNNTITLQTSGGSTGYGVYNYNPTRDTFYNNTFVTRGANTNAYAVYTYLSGTGNLFYNNVVANYTPGSALYVAGGTPNSSYMASDYNNVYSANGNHFNNNANVTSLQTWRNNTGLEKNSLCYDPGFISTTDLHPDPANPASWSLNGRGVHIAGNNVDFDGNPRVTTLAAGVPDIGAYEFTPTSIPPLATAIPATPTAGVPQTFLFGQDTVARIIWAPNSVVPNTIDVRQYTGTVAPTFPAPGYLYFYADINTANITYNFTADIYYKDPWRGTTGTEGNLRMIRKNGIWDAFNGSLSSTDVNRNIFRAASLNSTGWFTGIDDNTLFSAIVTAATNPIICAGGGVVLNANTGIGYVYQWLFNGLPIPGANGPSHTATQAGDYQVQITNSGNVTATSTPLSIVVVAAPSANVAASGPLTYCPGGVLNLNANTGPGLLYQWALNGTNIPGATNATYPVNVAGNYTVTVSNKGCATTSALIPVNAGPLNVQLGTDTAFCQSKTTPLVLNAGYPGAKYTWNTNDTGQTINIFDRSGTYWVRVDAGPNCVDEDTIVVNVSPLPSVVGISYGHTGSTFQFSAAGAQNVKRYLWIFGNTYQDTAQVATFTYNGWTAMEVKLVVFNDCGSDTSYLQLPLNINSSSAKDVIFNLYPNPAVSEVTLSAEGGVSLGEITILNGLGQVVYRGDANNNSAHTINVNSLANGRYLIRANTSDGMVISKPFNVVR